MINGKLSIRRLMILILLPTCIVSAQLSEVMRVDLERVDIACRILDEYADSLWPGWSGYRSIPVRFIYPDGTRMLISGEETPSRYHRTAATVGDSRKVYVDTSKIRNIVVKPPLVGGGQAIQVTGTVVEFVYPVVDAPDEWIDAWHLRRGLLPEESYRLRHMSEIQIHAIIHELFHAYASSVSEATNTDALPMPTVDYATYSELEGLALEKALTLSGHETITHYLQDFIVARQLKYNGVKELEGIAESRFETNEGLARYVELGIIRRLEHRGFPMLEESIDPYYFGFRDASHLYEYHLERLKHLRSMSYDVFLKSYLYGAIQACLLDSLSPGWKGDFLSRDQSLYETMRRSLSLDSSQVANVKSRLEERYGIHQLRRKHESAFSRAEQAIEAINRRHGMSYVIDLRSVGRVDFALGDNAIALEQRTKIYCPSGLGTLEFPGVTISTNRDPFLLEDYYYLRWVDDGHVQKDFDIEGTHLGNDVYAHVTVTARGFTLNAARLRIGRSPQFVKIVVLSEDE